MGVGAGVVAGVTAAFAAADAATVAAIGISLTTVFEITTAVGVGLSVIGAVTGNKVLSQVGMALGIVGGIGSLAGAAVGGVASAASGGFAEGLTPATAGAADASGAFIDSGSFAAADAAGTAAPTLAGTTLDAATGALEGPTLTGATLDTATNSTLDAASGALQGPADAGNTLEAAASLNNSDGSIPFMANDLGSDQVTANATSIGTASDNPLATDAAANATPAVDPNAAVTPANPSPTTTGVDAGNFGDVSTDPNFLAGKSAGTTADLNAAQYSGGSKGILGDLLKFANDNKTVASGIIQVGGSFLKGLTDSVSPAQVNALNAQAANNQAQANLTAQQTANLAMPKATANLSPVTGAPTPLITPRSVTPTVAGQAALPTGLMNRPGLAPVTGSVAA